MDKKEDPTKFPLLTTNIVNIKRFAESDAKDWSCYNPSIGHSPKKGYAIAFRSANYVILPHGELHVTNGGKIRNRIYFAETDKNLKLKNFRQIPMPDNIMPFPRGIEDPRLFWRDGHWMFAAVAMEEHTPVARFCICKLDAKATKIIDVEIFPGARPDKAEKNWLVPDLKPSEHFDFVYGPTAIIKDHKIITEFSDNKHIAGFRGNSHLVEQKDGTYIAVVHKLWISKSKGYSPNNFGMIDFVIKNYGHYFVRYDRFGSLVEASPAFQFIGQGIEFVGGMVEMDDNLVITFGKEDVSSHAAIFPKSQAFKMMKPLDQ
jgi:hypothetical protein